MSPADIRARIERAKAWAQGDDPELPGLIAADCEALLSECDMVRAERNAWEAALDKVNAEFQGALERLGKAAADIAKYRNQAAAYSDALTQQTIGLTEALGQTFSDPEQLYAMVRKLRQEVHTLGAERHHLGQINEGLRAQLARYEQAAAPENVRADSAALQFQQITVHVNPTDTAAEVYEKALAAGVKPRHISLAPDGVVFKP